MSDTKKLARFLVSPSLDGGDPQLVIELEDGFKLTLTATYEQIEDMADVLDEILDAAISADEGDAGQLPAFLRRGSPTTG